MSISGSSSPSASPFSAPTSPISPSKMSVSASSLPNSNCTGSKSARASISLILRRGRLPPEARPADAAGRVSVAGGVSLNTLNSVDAHDGASDASNPLELLLLPPKLLPPKPLPLSLPAPALPDGEGVHDELEEDAMAGRERQNATINLARGMHVSAIMCQQ